MPSTPLLLLLLLPHDNIAFPGQGSPVVSFMYLLQCGEQGGWGSERGLMALDCFLFLHSKVYVVVDLHTSGRCTHSLARLDTRTHVQRKNKVSRETFQQKEHR